MCSVAHYIMRKTTSLILLALLSSGLSAPIDVKEDAIEKRRDSTKETIELEEALKRLSGENKKFFPPPDGSFQPQVDGLDPHTNIDAGKADEDDADTLLDLANVPSADTAQEEEELQELNANANAIPPEEAQEELEEEAEDDDDTMYVPRPENDDDDDMFVPESDIGYAQPQYIDYGSPLYQDYYPDRYGEMENRMPPAYAMYDNIHYSPLENDYPNELLDKYGDMKPLPNEAESSDENNEYLLQNMFRVIQEHPEFLGLLQKGQLQAKEENEEDWDKDEEDLSHLDTYPHSQDPYSDNIQNGNVFSHPVEEEDEEAKLDSFNQHVAMQQSGYTADVLERKLEDKTMIKQLETLQDLYGDKGAHHVAKKMSLMGTNYIQEIEALPDKEDSENTLGSGEIENGNIIPEALETNEQYEESKEEDNKNFKDFRQMTIM